VLNIAQVYPARLRKSKITRLAYHIYGEKAFKLNLSPYNA